MTTIALFALALGAALAAYAGNRMFYRGLGSLAAVTVVPWWEELCKLGAAALLPAVPMLFVHVVFGALECAYDIWRGRDDAVFLGVISFAGHGLCGGVAMLAYDSMGSLGWAYLSGGLTHALYAAALVYAVLPTLGPRLPADPPRR
jgi:hypothetical protein